MGKTNFEKLRVYQLAEKLADQIWSVVIKWDYFAKVTVGQQIVAAADGVGFNNGGRKVIGRLHVNRPYVKIDRR